MRILFLSLLAALLCTAHAPQQPSGKDRLEWMIGDWSGIGYQINSNETWKVELIFTSIDDPILIAYPGLGCRGTWELSEFKDKRAVFVETIEMGIDKCLQGSKIIVTQVNQQHISLAFFHEDYSKEVMAFSVLKYKE